MAESSLLGLVAAGDDRAALMAHEHLRGSWIERRGQPYYDGMLESVAADRVVLRRSDGERLELILPSSEPGIVRRYQPGLDLR